MCFEAIYARHLDALSYEGVYDEKLFGTKIWQLPNRTMVRTWFPRYSWSEASLLVPHLFADQCQGMLPQ